MVITTLRSKINGFRKGNNFFVFELSRSMLGIHQERSQPTQDISGPHQDGGYYYWKNYGWFLIGLSISVLS